MEVMAVTLMLFVRLRKAHISARVKQALKEMDITAKVIYLLFDYITLISGYQNQSRFKVGPQDV